MKSAPENVSTEKPIIFYDGVCGLCNRFVSWGIARDRAGIFQFSPLQGETSRKILGPLEPDPVSWSVILRDEKGLHRRSAAVLRIVQRFGGIWTLARIFWLVPEPARDWAYAFIAKRRYRWFGKKESCSLSHPPRTGVFLP